MEEEKTVLRECCETIADFIRQDKVLGDSSSVTVVVEDKAVVAQEIAQAIGRMGVCILIAVTGFERRDQSQVLQGNLRLQISCYEQPELNRDDRSALTAQAASVRLAQILHYRRFPCFVGQMVFTDFARDDVDEANIVRGNYFVQTYLGDREG